MENKKQNIIEKRRYYSISDLIRWTIYFYYEPSNSFYKDNKRKTKI